MPRGAASPTTGQPDPQDWSPTMTRQQNWPLPAAVAAPQSPASVYSTSTRGPPPRRPPRPSVANAPPAIPPHQTNRSSVTTTPSNSAAGVWSQDGYLTPSARPSSSASGSVYSAPTNPPSTRTALPPPMPQSRAQQQPLPPQQRARAPLGPPPSARRGPSSYYPQYPSQLLVTPIVEESDSQRTSERGSFLRPDELRGSYASSNAIPIGIPNYYLNKNARYPRQTMDSFTSNYDDYAGVPPPQFAELSRQDSPPILIRKASLGKKSKPTLTTIKPAESNKPPQAASYFPATREAELSRSNSDESKGNMSRRTGSSGALDMAASPYLDRSGSDSEDDDYDQLKSKEYVYDDLTPPGMDESDPRVLSIINRLEKGGAIPREENRESNTEKQSAFSGGKIRPKQDLRIDVAAVKDAEARGSLTSLPDLIARATRLASNLDRGKTASRLGLDWAFQQHSQERLKNLEAEEKRSRPNSTANRLSLYPPFDPDRRNSLGSGRFKWPENLRKDETGRTNRAPRSSQRGRRYVCGMPLWAFFSLLLLLILLIAAAVIVPVVLIVIPKQNQQAGTTTLQSCQQKLQCQNSAINVVGTDNTCRCLCVNGFTGNTCTSSPGSQCVGVDATGARNATAGNDIPRLINDSQRNFSIPIDSAQVLSLFSMTNLNCQTQNGLISFTNSGTSRRKRSSPDGIPERIPTPTIARRQTPTTDTQPVITSAGIVFAAGTAPGAEATTASKSTTADQRDFARTAILFVLQDSGQLNWAIAARTAFDNFLLGNTAPGASSNNITLGNNYSADINSFRVVSRNGTVVGRGANAVL